MALNLKALVTRPEALEASISQLEAENQALNIPSPQAFIDLYRRYYLSA